MLKKYLFSLLLFSAPLFSVEPEKMSTQALKDEIARCVKELVVYRKPLVAICPSGADLNEEVRKLAVQNAQREEYIQQL